MLVCNNLQIFFLGYTNTNHKKITTIQPCLRVNDIDEIGKTNRHNSFFEMMGNFSFGAYWKKEAINMAISFLLSLGLKMDNIFVTTHTTDKESIEIWQSYTKKIIPLESNFWSFGDGPCGPCTEIFYSMEPLSLEECKKCLLNDEQNVKEIWNIVFMENRMEGSQILAGENKFIDTGMGLERLMSILEGHFDNFQTDLLKPIVEISQAEEINKKVSADFMKAIIFVLSEGLLPSNTGAGSVLKKLIRKVLDICPNWIEVGHKVIETMEEVYPHIKNTQFITIMESQIIRKKKIVWEEEITEKTSLFFASNLWS